ncbi:MULTISPECIES: ABC transporter ATP-binding protein [unclassified Hyphomonas]|jgi:ABC-2 type transport system ATP-binding protein|uniref:ABC transporter ATP-binding protein n=1 Tax=unclassified Hyphomonas TaxID=2630699 RepID=UPI000C43A448|nr:MULTISPECIES: ABC transporter ATP-binding protein [unclassified Hyphomonas]MAN90354.1 multidrug ABC transporter ATP-binding protein [Hyphomonadaceae bacterium]MAN91134.1 multidrug ABC transporter ATP-binding protein [Hyphomonadaceae bacterium]MBO6582465.1 ABC transporter ATP-binding protein [Hyphomonas sp.]MDF1806070.1 ABC transporter ATP-binding protein [Hyphomonas sp.]QSR22210.1 multidrug ABC transporter ATP-binding protein [Hyphomonas sp. KY3]|tara:strand:+ start:3635 stop:4588 length:954 start_codon:yes stop_codon:yes gene_type:complete
MSSSKPAPDFAIEVKDLNKIYRASGKMPEKHALKGLNLEIPRGSIFGLLGPNGAGKSTFINILAGLVNKTSGSASIWGLDIDKYPRQSRAAIGVVNQEIVADPFFTPLEMLELMAGFYGVPKSERRSLEILTAVGLDDKKDAYVRQLSGGMKRRLMVAKALVHNPPVLILDEPTAGVDVELRRSLWTYVRELHDKGTTIILTTHYLEEAEELCDSIAIVNHGEIVACEPTPQLLSRLDYKTLVITPKEPLATVPAALSDMDAVLRPDGDLAITFRSSETGIGRLLETVRSNGIGIGDLVTEAPDLEDVFIALTTQAA